MRIRKLVFELERSSGRWKGRARTTTSISFTARWAYLVMFQPLFFIFFLFPFFESIYIPPSQVSMFVCLSVRSSAFSCQYHLRKTASICDREWWWLDTFFLYLSFFFVRGGTVWLSVRKLAAVPQYLLYVLYERASERRCCLGNYIVHSCSFI